MTQPEETSVIFIAYKLFFKEIIIIFKSILKRVKRHVLRTEDNYLKKKKRTDDNGVTDGK